jgi:hypothetical protein
MKEHAIPEGGTAAVLTELLLPGYIACPFAAAAVAVAVSLEKDSRPWE